jgi:hypothetical protein
MAAKDMMDAIQNPHPEVPFSRVGNDTNAELSDLAAIFNLKLRQTPAPMPRAVPPTFFQLPCLADESNQILKSPMPLPQ